MRYHCLHIKTDFAEEWQRDLFEQQLFDLGVDTIDGEDYYIPSEVLESNRSAITDYLSSFNFQFSMDSCPDENWNAAWEAEHPMQELALGIKIIPHCAFGAGHHETTSMMIDQLMALNTSHSALSHYNILDHGTGTGVLAIFAKRLGAQRVVAVDIDDKSVENAKENAALNGEDIDVRLGDSVPEGQYDLILANIHRNILLANMEAYAAHLNNGGELWLSGFYESDCPILVQAAAAQGLHHTDTHAQGEWRMLKMKKENQEPIQEEGNIEVIGARVHNLKNISVSIPRKRLTVITGLSGSGKSSLAFDTIFAEGQRRYMETFSSYARGFIGQMQRPDVDKITGLSPVISIDQKTTSKNPRSTVGTITEVYDFLRLLYARAAQAYSYLSGKPMVKFTDEQIIDLIMQTYAGQKILLLAPLVSSRKGHYKELFETIRKKGFVHVRVDGEVQEITAGMKLDRYKNHTIEVVVDRLKIKGEPSEDDMRRLRHSIDNAMTQGNGIMMIALQSEVGHQLASVRYFSRNLMCPETGLSYPEPAPHTFSFNSPSGWCPCCKGLGKVKANGEWSKGDIDEVIRQENWWEELQELSGSDDGLSEEEEKEEWILCPECKGLRLSKEALSYRLGKYTISDLANMDIDELLAILSGISDSPDLTDKQKSIAAPILKEICARLRFMQSVGLSYLSLNRSSESLSGGESQRIRLATQIGSRLVNVLYILDEPSIGLHQRDNHRLINSLKELRDMNNSVIVVEHDEQIMREADWIVDIGPKAGRLGGKVLFSGTPDDLLKTDTLTAQYLKGEKAVISDMPDKSDKSDKSEHFLTLSGCIGNNLKHVTVKIPIGRMVCVTGVSGSGKSSLINQTLYPILSQHFYRSKNQPLPYKALEGIEHIDKVINVDQSPIGRTPRSNPATYTNVFNDIRELFAQLPEAKIRGWKAGRFSFNAKGGRCEECMGNGYKTIQMHFMPDVYVPCEACGGQRYNRETLEVRWKGKTIADILDMTVNQAVEFFEPQPKILRKIKTIQDVGLGYIKLGQASTSLSGGESQRIKLATELSRPSTGKTLYILDEPTTGLHFEDIRVLLNVLRQLVNKGNTVIIIEHNTDVIRACDWIIDMGPEGGRAGGEIVATGTIEDIRSNTKSITGQYI